jgi:hypothetical protein
MPCPTTAADWEQGDVSRANAVTRGGQRVTELMEYDAAKECEDESYAFGDCRHAVTLVPVDQRDPGDHHEERGVKVDVDPGNAGQFP